MALPRHTPPPPPRIEITPIVPTGGLTGPLEWPHGSARLSLASLRHLESLDLSNNALTGPLPGALIPPPRPTAPDAAVPAAGNLASLAVSFAGGVVLGTGGASAMQPAEPVEPPSPERSSDGPVSPLSPLSPLAGTADVVDPTAGADVPDAGVSAAAGADAAPCDTPTESARVTRPRGPFELGPPDASDVPAGPTSTFRPPAAAPTPPPPTLLPPAPPLEWGSVGVLRSLCLQRNRLTGALPGALSALVALEIFRVDSNRLTVSARARVCVCVGAAT
jgi:hypothetical protein